MADDAVSADRDAPTLSGDGVRIALVCGRFNDFITMRLLDGAHEELQRFGVGGGDVHVTWVPGAFEIPLVAKTWAESGRVDAVVALGAVIRGETGHYDFVAGECARGIQDVQLATGVPVVFGVLTTDTLDQALARSGEADNKGEEAVRTALEMISVLGTIRS